MIIWGISIIIPFGTYEIKSKMYSILTKSGLAQMRSKGAEASSFSDSDSDSDRIYSTKIYKYHIRFT